MKKLLTLITAGIFLLAIFPEQSRAQCVINTGSNEIGIASGTGSTALNIDYASALNITVPGTYRYTWSYAGGTPLLDNLSLIVGNSTSWTPLGPLSFGPGTTDLKFNLSNFYSQSPLCTYEIVTLQFQRQSGSSWFTMCSYTFKVTITESSRNNLAFTEGYSTLFYKGDDYHMYTESWNGSGWAQSAITPSGGWGSVQVAGNICTSTDNTSVYFKGTNNNLYQLYNNGSSWALSTISANVDPASSISSRSTNEVVFLSNSVTGSKLYQCFYNGTSWTNTYITPSGGWGAVSVKPASITLVPGTSDIFFSSTSEVIYNLHNFHGTWALTLIGSGTSGMEYVSDLVATDNSSVYYRGGDYRIHCFNKIGSTWTFDPMNSSNGYALATGFLTKFPNDDRVFYKSDGGDIFNIYKSGGVWYNYPLDYYFTGAAGDLVAAEGKIFYINKDKTIHNFLYSGGWIDGALVSSPANAFGCSNQYVNGDYFRHAAPTTEEVQVDNSASDFDVYPNPSNGIFQLNLKTSADNAQVELVNLLGERVDAFTFSGDTYNYSPAQTPAPGIYLLRVTNNGTQCSKKIIIH